jgi:hypothetical protein
MGAVLVLLAAGCLVTGIAGAWILSWLQSVPESVLGITPVREDGGRMALAAGGSFSPLLVAILLFALAPLPWLVARALFGAPRTERGPVWSTGVTFRPTMQYTGTSFSKPLRLFFGRILLPEREIEVVYHGASPLPHGTLTAGAGADRP